VLNTLAYLMGDPIIFWWIICCKNSVSLRNIGKYLFNLKGKLEIYAIKSNISSNMPKQKYTKRNKKIHLGNWILTVLYESRTESHEQQFFVN
jgi:hypothetical protein